MSEPSSMVALAQEYLDYRRRLGSRLRSEGKMLLAFARYADRLGHRGPLTTELAVHWARSSVNVAPRHPARRLQVVRGFARYRAIFDPATEIPPEGPLGPAQRRTTPHIYSEAELTALLVAAGRLRSPTGLRRQTYSTLIGLLSCTGLRIAEALKLTRGDLDWGQSTLTIRETKFHKSRLVPLHPTTLRAMESYARFRDACHPSPQTDAFFVSERGTPLPSRTVQITFGKLRAHLPVASCHEGRAPRIYDLRHNADSRIMPTGIRWVTRDPVNRTGSSRPDAA